MNIHRKLNEFRMQSWKIPGFSSNVLRYLEEISWQIWICKIPTQFDQLSARTGTKIAKHLLFCLKICEKITKIRDESLLNCWGRRGAKECKSDRSRQECSNEYSIEKVGFDIAENEYSKVAQVIMILAASRGLVFTDRSPPMHDFLDARYFG